MTNAELIATIRNEIERLQNCNRRMADYAINSNMRNFYDGEEDCCRQLLSFISTLESEKTISPWKKIHTYTEEIHEGDIEKMLLELSVGKGEKRTKTALPDRIVNILESEKPVPNDLEEAGIDNAAKEYAFNNADNNSEYMNSYLGFKAGAEWLAKQGISYKATISADKTIPVLPMKDVSNMGLDYGDRVRIIIVKEE